MIKSLLLATVMLLVYTQLGVAQSIIPEALTPRIFDENGDPQTNVEDMNGARQGNWTYQDIYGNLIVLEKYVDHNLVSTHYPALDQSEEPVWTTISEWDNNPDPYVKEDLKTFLIERFDVLGNDQQIACFFNGEGNLVQFSPLGNWDEKAAKEIEAKFYEYVKQANLNIKDETFILL